MRGGQEKFRSQKVTLQSCPWGSPGQQEPSGGAVGEIEAAPSHNIKGQGEVTLRSLGIIDRLLQSITEKKNVPKYSDPRHKISPCEVNTFLKENLRTTCTLKDILKVKKKKMYNCE